MKKTQTSELWKRITRAMNAAGYEKFSQELVGRLAGGLRQTSVRKWKIGLNGPEMENAQLLAKRLNISVEWLLTGKGPMRPVGDLSDQAEELLSLYSKMDQERREELLAFARYCRTISRPDDSKTTH